MSGFALGQNYGYGLTEQSTISPGQQGAPVAPDAGAAYTLTLSRYDRWRLVAVTFTLDTSDADATRVPRVEYSGTGGVPNMVDPTGVTVAASASGLSFSGGLNIGSYVAPDGGDVGFPLSGLWLEAGSTVTLNVLAIDTDDQLSDIRFTFDRFPGGGYVPAESDVPN